MAEGTSATPRINDPDFVLEVIGDDVDPDDEPDERPTTASAATDPELGEGETPPDRAYPTRTALHEALIQLENEATEVVLAALTPVLTNAAARLVADPGSIAATVGLTASAVEDLTSIIEEWGGAVDATVIPHYEKVFQLGGISAVTQLARLGAVTDDFTERTGEYFDEATARYLALAKDRFLRLGDDAWRDARQVMLNGVDRGYGIDVIAQNLRGVVQLSEASARMLARTEVVGAANGGALKQAQLAADAAPLYKAWLATDDARVRPTHWEVDMRVTGLHDVWRVGGALLEYPGDPSGPPEETLNCRCSILLLDDPAELEGGFPGRGEGGVLADVADLEGGES